MSATLKDPAAQQRDTANDTVYDVAIVGYGPVGQLLAALLGDRGFRVVVLERYGEIYPKPRAVHFDHEVARILQAVGIRADTSPVIEPYDDWYEWKNADRQTLLKVDWRGVGPSYWHTSNFFSQPELEHELDARARTHPSVEIRRNCRVVDLTQNPEGVSLGVLQHSSKDDLTDTVRARYVVGCDGANSTVRSLLGIEVADLGFFFDWLILDMIPNEPMHFDPPAWQLCDPVRPTTIVPGGPGRRRWEFMALPGEDVNDLNKPETAWSLLEPWGLNPENATLERHTVYQFQAQWADSWRSGRVLIAGDAAHLMPPFAGQGMCGGLRDVFNLAWKLDLVLREVGQAGLLDSYTVERTPHVRYFINMSIELGRVICVPDPSAAAERDKAMMAALREPSQQPEPPSPPRLGPGIFAVGDSRAGLLSIQSTVTYGDTTGLFDDVVGYGWFVLTENPLIGLAPSTQRILDRLDARTLVVAPTGPGVDVIDRDGRYTEWFRELGDSIVVIRPDFYVYGATSDHSLFEDLVTGLGAQVLSRT